MNTFKQTLPNISKTQKARMIAAFCICLILNVNAILYAYEILNYQPVAEAPADNIYVDGSDFTPLVNMAVAGYNGAIYMLPV